MQADARSFAFITAENIVKIPFFQRGYIWNSLNWADLLEDLLDETKKTFLGSLILKQTQKQTGTPTKVLVIDGQQRLTTISILLRAIYDTFPQTIKNNCSNVLESHLFYKKQATKNDLYVKIEHSYIDSTNYKKVIKNELSASEFDSIDKKSNRILQCYKYFYEKIIDLAPDKKEKLFNDLVDHNNKILVIVDLSNNDDEQSIFDTINSAGVRLSGADIIKNALFQKALSLKGDDSENTVIEWYKEYWGNIFLKDEETIEFWETVKVTGRLKRDNIELLLHSFAIIKKFFNPDKHTLSDLTVLYKKHIKDMGENCIVEFLKDLKSYAGIYRNKFLVFNRSEMFSFENFEQRLFHILDITEISTFHPYVLFLYYNHQNDMAKLKDEFLKLEKFVVKRMICKKETKSYNKTCRDLIANDLLINDKMNEIANNEIRDAIENISNKNANLLLFWIELYRRNNDSMQSVRELKFNYSLEHIMPQKWEEHWQNVPVYDDNGKIIQDKLKAKDFRDKKVYALGNMTLLNSRLNTSIRNHNLIRKINGDGKKRGIRKYADLTIIKDDILNPFDKNIITQWNENEINRRTENLFNEIKTIWT
ncbi:MAG: DUF262 domain-containing HNH endonuclease family protein [Spirochaetia bacterium]|nr:DUF262 domain-containing HNH endonuclease family protein [Spirochaetia bacterium]